MLIYCGFGIEYPSHCAYVYNNALKNGVLEVNQLSITDRHIRLIHIHTALIITITIIYIH